MIQQYAVETSYIEEILRIVREHTPSMTRTIFRGVPDKNFTLIPKLYRGIEESYRTTSNEEAFDRIEELVIGEFFARARPYISAEGKSWIEKRMIAQHFGAPTRLLDWSADPFVALYFAVSDHSYDGKDAAIYALQPFDYPMSAYREADVHADRFLRVLRPPVLDDRIVAQKGLFTLHNFGGLGFEFEPLDDRAEMNPDNLTFDVERCIKITISSNSKEPYRQTLRSFGFHHNTLFPGLDGVGRSVATDFMDRYYLRNEYFSRLPF